MYSKRLFVLLHVRSEFGCIWYWTVCYGISYTYHRDDFRVQDHVLTLSYNKDNVMNIKCIDCIHNFSDHVPLSFEDCCDWNIHRLLNSKKKNDISSKICWENISYEHIELSKYYTVMFAWISPKSNNLFQNRLLWALSWSSKCYLIHGVIPLLSLWKIQH